jgi:DNA-binding transcriptional LysR family regulator
MEEWVDSVATEDTSVVPAAGFRNNPKRLNIADEISSIHPMNGLQQLMAFSRTARLGSFAAAARELGCAPSTLAKTVARLEAALGVKLFHRTTRQVSLTPDGEHLFRRCERVLAEVEDLEAEAAGSRGTVSGTLRLDAPLTYGRRVLQPLLAQLLQAHPALKLDLRLRDSYADLAREGLDAAIRVGELRDSSLVARRFDWQHLVLVGSPGYVAAHGRPAGIEELQAHAAIVFRLPASGRGRPWQFSGPQGLTEWSPQARVQINDGEGMVAAAVAGCGLAQVPDNMVTGELQSGALIELLPELRPPAMPISVVIPSARLQPPRVRALLALLDTLRT